jgi:hypothetical protein
MISMIDIISSFINLIITDFISLVVIIYLIKSISKYMIILFFIFLSFYSRTML